MFYALGVSAFAFSQQTFGDFEASIIIQGKSVVISWLQNSLFFVGASFYISVKSFFTMV
jgi:hypothetical protein